VFGDIVSEAEQLDEASVLADRLQAEGDPRGELLALEIGCVRAPSVAQARALARQAQDLRAAEAGLVWRTPHGPDHVSLRAGFVVGLSGGPGTPAHLAARAAGLDMRGLRTIRGVGMAELLPDVVTAQPSQLDLRIEAKPRALDELVGGLRRLVELTCSVDRGVDVRATFERLARLDSLRGLRAVVDDRVALAHLRHTKISHLRVSGVGEGLGELVKLSELRHLEMRGTELDANLDQLGELPLLDSLHMRAAFEPNVWRKLLAGLHLSRVRLDVDHGFRDQAGSWRQANAQLGAQLETLCVDVDYIDGDLLRSWPKLRRLTLLGHRGFEQLPPLEHLGATLELLAGLDQLPGPSLALYGALDFDDLRRLWARLAVMQDAAPLRTLEISHMGDQLFDARAVRAFERLEHLTLDVPPTLEDVARLRELPRLRRLTVRVLDPRGHRKLCEALPDVLVESTDQWPQAPFVG
jgi:hypothetical protein